MDNSYDVTTGKDTYYKQAPATRIYHGLHTEQYDSPHTCAAHRHMMQASYEAVTNHSDDCGTQPEVNKSQYKQMRLQLMERFPVYIGGDTDCADKTVSNTSCMQQVGDGIM